MRALVKKLPQEGLWLEEVPIPTIGEDDVLIKIRKVSICGTDLHIYKWDDWARRTLELPLVIGHEFVGEIVEVGRNVHSLKVGERVCAEGHLVCGHCRNCQRGKKHLCPHTRGLGVNRPGCFADYLSFPAVNVFSVPDSISDEQACLFDPLGNGVHTALSFDLVGEDVLVTGAGSIGVMAAAVACKVGARNVVITDINDYHVELAKKMEIPVEVNVHNITLRDIMPALHMKYGFDVVLEMSGSIDALRSAIDLCYHGGKIALLGILPSDASIDWQKVIFKGLTLKGIYGREIFETWYKMVALIEAGLDISKVITHTFPLEEYEKGFAAMASGRCGKVILNVNE